MISFEVFKYGVYGIWVYSNQEDFNLGEPVFKKSEDDFQDTLEKIQGYNCFKTKVVLESIKPKFVPSKIERFKELQEKYQNIENLNYDEVKNNVTFVLNENTHTINERTFFPPDVINPNTEKFKIFDEILTILIN